MLAKEHFYMFSCDSSSSTENSWSVPEKEREREMIVVSQASMT